MLRKIEGRRRRGRQRTRLVGWHRWHNGREFEQALGDGEGQRSLGCCCPWGRKESGMTEQRNNNKHLWSLQYSTLNDPKNRSPPGTSVHGILQAGILEWVTNPFSRGSSWPRDGTQISRIASWFLTLWASREALLLLLSHCSRVRLCATP